MKQVNYSKYGNSSVLEITDVRKPSLKKKNSLLVRVLYSSLNAIDWKNRKGDFRLVTGLWKPGTKQGFDVLGVVTDKSPDVTEFDLNDKVVGLLGNFSGGALSEYVLVRADQIVRVAEHLPLAEVAGLPMAGITAWQALLKDGKQKEHDKVLINGGSSGVGHLAIQIAKAYGAEVTTVSSGRNSAFCKELGADFTIDYARTDFRKVTKKYDIIFDVVFNASLRDVNKILQPKGYYIGTTPSPRLIRDVIFTRQARFVAVKPNKEALTDLMTLLEKGQLKVMVDKIYPMEQIAEAHDYIEQSRTRGKLVIKIGKEASGASYPDRQMLLKDAHE